MSDSESEDESAPYNPLNLPLGMHFPFDVLSVSFSLSLSRCSDMRPVR